MKFHDNLKDFLPYRLREARIARAMSAIDLAEKIGVSKQSISQFELGRTKPSDETLFKICHTLRLPLSFFLTESNVGMQPTSVSSYRSTSGTRKKYKNSSEQKMIWVYEIYDFLSEYIDFPKVDIPLELMQEKEFYSSDEIEEITLKLREYWNLGNDPINSMISILHLAGIVVGTQTISDSSIEAFSKWIGNTPVIILNSNKQNPCRLRFTLAHELGHLILHSYPDDSNNPIGKERQSEIETEAHRFASSFLMPESSFADDVFSPTPDALLLLKKSWKVSVQSMLRRCLDIGIISENQYTYGCKIISKKGWKKEEPGDFNVNLESPYMLKQAIEILLDNKIFNTSSLVKSLNLYSDEIEELCSLPSGYLNTENTEKKLKLTLVK